MLFAYRTHDGMLDAGKAFSELAEGHGRKKQLCLRGPSQESMSRSLGFPPRSLPLEIDEKRRVEAQPECHESSGGASARYASALFAGWYAFLAPSDPPADAFVGPWAPVWAEEEQCWILGQSGQPYGPCNPGLDDAVAGLVNGLASGCWVEPGAGGKAVLTVYGPGPPQPQPVLPGFDEWAARQLHPAPESDPCIPCVDGGFTKALALGPGLREGGTNDLLLNLSASLSSDPSLRLDRVYFRVEEDFYPLDLAPGDLAALEQGAAGGLVLAGYGSLLPSLRQPSLFYVFSSDPSADCAAPAPDPTACFWSSTPVFLP